MLAKFFKFGNSRMYLAQPLFDLDLLSAGIVLQPLDAHLLGFDIAPKISVLLLECTNLVPFLL